MREEKSLRDRGYNVGVQLTSEFSLMTSAHPDSDDDEFMAGLMEAVKDYYEFVENGVKPDWIVEMEESFPKSFRDILDSLSQ